MDELNNEGYYWYSGKYLINMILESGIFDDVGYFAPKCILCGNVSWNSLPQEIQKKVWYKASYYNFFKKEGLLEDARLEKIEYIYDGNDIDVFLKAIIKPYKVLDKVHINFEIG